MKRILFDMRACSTQGKQCKAVAGNLTCVCCMLFLLPAAVTGLDMCVRRPLVATCSSDHTVRLWNYADRTCDLSKWFAEEAHSIAIHPTGLMVREQLQHREGL